MKENWFAILMFSVLFGVLGFILGRITCTDCCAPDHGHHNPHAECCAPGSPEAAECHKEIRIHQMHGEGGDLDVQSIIETLEVADFEGDTTVIAGDAVIHMTKSGDGKVEVNVEVTTDGEGSEEVIVKTIEIVEEEASH